MGMRGTEVLVETREIIKGESSTRNWLPAVKRRPDENMYLAARRCLESYLGINENAVLFNTSTVLTAEEEKESQTYPGLPSLYRKRIITAHLALAEDLPVPSGSLSIASNPRLTQQIGGRLAPSASS